MPLEHLFANHLSQLELPVANSSCSSKNTFSESVELCLHKDRTESTSETVVTFNWMISSLTKDVAHVVVKFFHARCFEVGHFIRGKVELVPLH